MKLCEAVLEQEKGHWKNLCFLEYFVSTFKNAKTKAKTKYCHDTASNTNRLVLTYLDRAINFNEGFYKSGTTTLPQTPK